jgi:hypothetical protein
MTRRKSGFPSAAAGYDDQAVYDDQGMPKGRIITTTSNVRSTVTSRSVSKSGYVTERITSSPASLTNGKTRSLMRGSHTVNETSNTLAAPDGPDHVPALDKICKAYGRHLRQINNDFSPIEIKPKDQIHYPGSEKLHLVQIGTTAKFMMEIFSISDIKNPRILDNKTIGYVRLKNQLPTSIAVSGWTAPCRQRSQAILDNEFWTDVSSRIFPFVGMPSCISFVSTAMSVGIYHHAITSLSKYALKQSW